MPLPVRIKFDELPADALPRSSTAKFSDKWQYSVGDEGFIDARCRALACCRHLRRARYGGAGASPRRGHGYSRGQRVRRSEARFRRRGWHGRHALTAGRAQRRRVATTAIIGRRRPARPELDLRRSPPPVPPPLRRVEPQARWGNPRRRPPAGSTSRSSAARAPAEAAPLTC